MVDKVSAVKDRDLLRAVGRVLFVSKSDKKASADEQRKAWTAGKEGAIDEARQFIRRLEKKGVILSRDPSND
jgi:hypothetical protein